MKLLKCEHLKFQLIRLHFVFNLKLEKRTDYNWILLFCQNYRFVIDNKKGGSQQVYKNKLIVCHQLLLLALKPPYLSLNNSTSSYSFLLP